VFGSCLFDGSPGFVHDASYKDMGCSKRLPEIGAFHHFLGIFYGDPVEADRFVPPFAPDEYNIFANATQERPVHVTSLNGTKWEWLIN
jgi:hypothetical protein